MMGKAVMREVFSKDNTRIKRQKIDSTNNNNESEMRKWRIEHII